MDETVVSRDGPVEEAALRRRNSAIQDKEGEMNGAFWEHQEVSLVGAQDFLGRRVGRQVSLER